MHAQGHGTKFFLLSDLRVKQALAYALPTAEAPYLSSESGVIKNMCVRSSGEAHNTYADVTGRMRWRMQASQAS